MKRADAEGIGLPVRPFLYTLDQIATLLEIQQVALEQQHIHFEGRSVGARPKDKMVARNVAAVGERPDWRIVERELMRWMRRKGFRFYERAWARA